MTSLTRPQLALALSRSQPPLPNAGRSGYRPVICALALLAADCLAVLGVGLVVFRALPLVWLGIAGSLNPAASLSRLEFVVPFIAIIAYLAVKGRYRERIPFWTETRLVVSASLFAAGAEAVLEVLAGDTTECGLTIAALLVFPIFATLANRLAKHALSAAGVWILPVVVIGDGPSAAEAETALGSDRSLGYSFVGRIDPDVVMSAPTGSRLWPVLIRYHARRLLIALDVDGDRQRRVIECALRERVPFAMVPQPYAFPAFACEQTQLFSHDTMLLSFRDGLSRPISRFAKAIIDITVAALLLVLTSPLFLVLAIISRLDGGPTLFAHQRVGAQGRPFRCLKFRTMVVDADRVLKEALARDPALAEEWVATRKLVNDPRVTPVGRFLRRTSLDELPQLINVLRLDMSLVGPRPIVESEIPLYGEDIAQYYATRPGLTGLWQVSGRNNTTYARRVQLDVWYVNNWTIWHDITVLLKTIPAVFGRQGAY